MRPCPLWPSGASARLHVDPRESRAMPGTRAALLVRRGDQQISTLDLAAAITPLAASAGAAWCDAARSRSAARPARRIRGMEDCTIRRRVCRGRRYRADRRVLVRPDGFVAWRAGRSAAGAAVLSNALRDPVPQRASPVNVRSAAFVRFGIASAALTPARSYMRCTHSVKRGARWS